MSPRHRQLIAGAAAAALVLVPVAAQAETRAGDSAIIYTSAASLPAGALPESSWLMPKEDKESALWQWVTAGFAFMLLFAVAIAGDPQPNGPRSNGAN